MSVTGALPMCGKMQFLCVCLCVPVLCMYVIYMHISGVVVDLVADECDRCLAKVW
jgi:hypothetical protein